jgi:ABC-type cobalamin/Fe3+-siderophores transport system ATPase subunit
MEDRVLADLAAAGFDDVTVAQARVMARRTEVAVQEEWTRHLGRRNAARLHELLIQLREVTDPYI